jgi:hypothetical protein
MDLANQACGALLDHGVKGGAIRLVVDRAYSEAGAETHDLAARSGVSLTTTADAGAGAIKGAGLGLLFGALGTVISLTIPGFGIVVGGGALATALAATGGSMAAGAAAGAVVGLLVDQGVPRDIAMQYRDTVSRGGAVLAVRIDDDMDAGLVEGALDKYGGQACGSYDEAAGWSIARRPGQGAENPHIGETPFAPGRTEQPQPLATASNAELPREDTIHQSDNPPF